VKVIIATGIGYYHKEPQSIKDNVVNMFPAQALKAAA